jgi:hypothetical protein
MPLLSTAFRASASHDRISRAQPSTDQPAGLGIARACTVVRHAGPAVLKVDSAVACTLYRIAAIEQQATVLAPPLKPAPRHSALLLGAGQAFLDSNENLTHTKQYCS